MSRVYKLSHLTTGPFIQFPILMRYLVIHEPTVQLLLRNIMKQSR